MMQFTTSDSAQSLFGGQSFPTWMGNNQSQSIDFEKEASRTLLANAYGETPQQKESSALDPIYLVESDDLIQAKMKLERQRPERALEEQVQQRRLGTRQRNSDQQALPDFDVNECSILYSPNHPTWAFLQSSNPS